jgi:hypothetical protein
MHGRNISSKLQKRLRHEAVAAVLLKVTISANLRV